MASSSPSTTHNQQHDLRKEKAAAENSGLAKQLEELKLTLTFRDKETEELRAETEKKLTDSEEFRQVVDRLNQRETDCTEKDKQLEQMYGQLAALEEERQRQQEKQG